MSKNTVRAAAFAIFNNHLASRAEVGNTAFRKAVIGEIMQKFNCTLSSASTYYNTAFKQAKMATPSLVEGLGRPAEKNNGGRKAKILVNVVEKDTGKVVAQGISRNAAAEMIAFAAAQQKPALEAVLCEQGVLEENDAVQVPVDEATTGQGCTVVVDEDDVVDNLVEQLVDTLVDDGTALTLSQADAVL